MEMRLIQKQKQVAKQELTPIRHLQIQQRVAIRLPLHQQLLQTQHLANATTGGATTGDAASN